MIDRDRSRLNLLASPYRVLRIDPTATDQQIQAAYAAALEQAPPAEQASADARAAILDPARRLLCELSYPLDGTPAQIELVYAALANGTPGPPSLVAEQLPPLSRANFLAQLAACRSAGSTLLLALLDAHISIDVTELYELLKHFRNEAGWPTPSLVNVNEGLQHLFDSHAEATLEGYGTVEDSIQPMLECARHVLATGEPYLIDAFSGLLDVYRRSITVPGAMAEQQIEDACAVLQQRSDEARSIEAFGAALHRWIALYRPLLALHEYQRRPDSDLESAIDRVHRLIDGLTIEQKYPTALNIVGVARAAFGSTPGAVGQYSQDAAFLQNLTIEDKIKPLHSLIDQFVIDPYPLIKSLESNGFGRGSSQPARNLWNVFCRSIKAASSSGLDAQPWLILRDFAQRLGDRPEAAKAAVRLLAGMVRHAERTSADPVMLTSLRDGLSYIEQTHQMTVRTGSRLLERYGKRLAFACGTLVGAAFCLAAYRYFDTTSALSLIQGPRRAVEQSFPIPGRELVPAVGKEQHLALDYIRYCRFQEERLRIIKGLVQGADDVKAFNALATDYNSRCGNFYYLDDDLKMVMDELGTKHEALEADAKRIVAAWPWRAATSNAPAPAAK